MRRPTFRRGPQAAAASGLLVALLLAGCGSSPPAARVEGHIGTLEIVDAFLPMPASPSVAAVYLTIRNSGPTADALVEVSTPDAGTSMLMTEGGTASTGTMTNLSELRIPGHGEASLSPGHAHAMLEEPRVTLKVGQRIPVTLRFAVAGRLTIEVPVVPLSAITQAASD